MDKKQLKLWFYNFMDKHHLNQRQMARELGVSDAYFSEKVRGKSYLTTRLINNIVCTWGMSPADYEFLQQYTMSKKKLLAKRVEELEKENKKLKREQPKVSGIQQIKNYVTDNLYLKIQLQDYLNFMKFLDKLEG